MNKILLPVLMLSTLLFSYCSVFAESQLKIAYVNLNRAINLSNEGKRSKTFLEAQAQETRKGIQNLENDLKQKESDLSNMMMLTPEARGQKELEISQMKLDLRNRVAKAQKDFRADEARHTGKIFEDIKAVIKTMATKEKYDLVLEYSLRQTLLFSKYTIVDITDTVINAYNQQQTIK
ncbi:MAG: OmpH family outer membrane protein [Proteobacteria bacterium]|nr:OmpH family outer membrane protein [Pseudomonadota bacterium]